MAIGKLNAKWCFPHLSHKFGKCSKIFEIKVCHNLLSGNELVVKALQVVPNEDIARHLKKMPLR